MYVLFISARPKGKSYLFFTQFKAELKGAKIEYANAYVSIKETPLSDANVACPVYMNLFFCLSTDPGPPQGKLRVICDGFFFQRLLSLMQ